MNKELGSRRETLQNTILQMGICNEARVISSKMGQINPLGYTKMGYDITIYNHVLHAYSNCLCWMVKHDENIHCKCWYTVYPIFGQLHLGVATIRCMAPSYLCHRVAFSIQHSHFWRMRKELSNQKIDFGKHCSTLGSHHFWRVQSGCALRERIHFNYLQLVSISRRKITFQTVSHHFHHFSHVFPCFPMFSHVFPFAQDVPNSFATIFTPHHRNIGIRDRSVVESDIACVPRRDGPNFSADGYVMCWVMCWFWGYRLPDTCEYINMYIYYMCIYNIYMYMKYRK